MRPIGTYPFWGATFWALAGLYFREHMSRLREPNTRLIATAMRNSFFELSIGGFN
jgi:hypothetical protein